MPNNGFFKFIYCGGKIESLGVNIQDTITISTHPAYQRI